MARLKLISNISEFGLFHGIARTRARLIVSTLIATAACIGIGLASANYIMETSTSVILNILIIAANMLVMMIAGYLQTITIGDIFFKGPWREQVILGQRTWKEDADADVVVANHNAEFMIILGLMVVINAIAVNTLADGFFQRYQEEGFFRAKMRSADPEERVEALRHMADPTQFSLWENVHIQQLVEKSLSDEDAKVREQAAWNAGVMKVKIARDELVALVGDKNLPDSVRSEAAVALGKLEPDVTARKALEAAIQEDKSPVLTLGMLRGLGMMEQKDSFPYILEVAKKPANDEIMLYALWAMHRTQHPEARIWLHEQLEAKPKGQRQCALLDAMKMVSTPEDINWARKKFMSTPKEQKCERVVWEERDESQRTIVFSDTLRTKYMKIVANSGESAKYRSWFQRIVNDPNEPWSVRESGSDIIRQLNQAGL